MSLTLSGSRGIFASSPFQSVEGAEAYEVSLRLTSLPTSDELVPNFVPT